MNKRSLDARYYNYVNSISKSQEDFIKINQASRVNYHNISSVENDLGPEVLNNLYRKKEVLRTRPTTKSEPRTKETVGAIAGWPVYDYIKEKISRTALVKNIKLFGKNTYTTIKVLSKATGSALSDTFPILKEISSGAAGIAIIGAFLVGREIFKRINNKVIDRKHYIIPKRGEPYNQLELNRGPFSTILRKKYTPFGSGTNFYRNGLTLLSQQANMRHNTQVIKPNVDMVMGNRTVFPDAKSASITSNSMIMLNPIGHNRSYAFNQRMYMNRALLLNS